MTTSDIIQARVADGTFALALVTFFLVLETRRLAREAQLEREQSGKPYLVADMEHGRGKVRIVNVGRGPAINVRYCYVDLYLPSPPHEPMVLKFVSEVFNLSPGEFVHPSVLRGITRNTESTCPPWVTDVLATCTVDIEENGGRHRLAASVCADQLGILYRFGTKPGDVKVHRPADPDDPERTYWPPREMSEQRRAKTKWHNNHPLYLLNELGHPDPKSYMLWSSENVTLIVQ